MKITIQITLEMEDDDARRTGGVRDHQNSESLSNAYPGDDLLPQSRQGTDSQGNEPVPGRTEEEYSLSGEEFAKGWRWDDDHQERVRTDQDPTGETHTDAEKIRYDEARKAAVAERLRELEYARQKKEVHEAFEKANNAGRGANYKDLFGGYDAPE